MTARELLTEIMGKLSDLPGYGRAYIVDDWVTWVEAQYQELLNREERVAGAPELLSPWRTFAVALCEESLSTMCSMDGGLPGMRVRNWRMWMEAQAQRLGLTLPTLRPDPAPASGEEHPLIARAKEALKLFVSGRDDDLSGVGGDLARIDTLMIKAYNLGIKRGREALRAELRALLVGEEDGCER